MQRQGLLGRLITNLLTRPGLSSTRWPEQVQMSAKYLSQIIPRWLALDYRGHWLEQFVHCGARRWHISIPKPGGISAGPRPGLVSCWAPISTARLPVDEKRRVPSDRVGMRRSGAAQDCFGIGSDESRAPVPPARDLVM
jgi:hypothetical protein